MKKQNYEIKLPDYNKSTLSLINTILFYYQKENDNILKNLLELLNEKKEQNIVLMIFDGLGNISLENASKKGLFNTNKFDVISSVFPSTTVAAINTIVSGKPPIENGWLGWSLYFKELNKSIDVFRKCYSGTNEEVDKNFDYKKIIEYKNIFSQIKESTKSHFNEENMFYFSPSSISEELVDCSNFKYSNLSKGLKKLKEVINKQKESFTYFYCDYPDSLMHLKGPNSIITNLLIRNMQRKVKKLLNKTNNITILLSADHGLIPIKGYIDIKKDKELGRMLKRKPSIETRACTVWIKDKYKEEFKNVFLSRYQDYFIIKTKEEVLNEKLFGDSNIVHPRVNEFLGDYLIIAKAEYCIGSNEHKPLFKGNHAGMTVNEMTVPLIILRK